MKYKWVSVELEERLPLSVNEYTPPSDVLTYNKYGMMRVATCAYSHGEIVWYDADDVTHWMPLPKPPVIAENKYNHE